MSIKHAHPQTLSAARTDASARTAALAIAALEQMYAYHQPEDSVTATEAPETEYDWAA